MQAEGEIVQLPTERVAPPKDFRTFFEEEHGPLFKTLYFVTGNRTEAADLMQEAFAKLWERWDTIDRIDDPTAYLFKVALNGNRMRLRAARRAAKRPIPLGIVRDPFDEVDIREDVLRMLRDLAPRHEPPSSCSICTDTAPKRPHGSWASVRRPSARWPRKVGPCSAAKEAPMHDLREVFEMVTKQTEPDLDSWKQQQDRQRRRARDRKLGAIGLVAAFVVGLVVFALTRPPGGNDMPAKSVSVTPSVPFNTTPPIGPQIVRTDGTPITQLPDALWSGQSVRLSPDGTAIAYIAADGSVHTVGIDGTGDRALTDASNSNTGDAQNHVEWSVDGTHLVYAYSGNIYTI